MAAKRQYPAELRERATRMAVEARQDLATRVGALVRVGRQLDVPSEALRTWVKNAETGAGIWPGTTNIQDRRVRELECEVRELRRANTILKQASVFFAAELDRPQR